METFIQKLVHIQSELKAKKSQYNSFGKYHYRKAEDILEAAKPLLKDTGLYLKITDSIVQMGDRFYVKATAIISDGTTTESCDAFAREEQEKKGMDGSQVTGASSSYARKYALNGLFGIDDTADSDGQAAPASQTQQQQTSTSSTPASEKKNATKKPDGPVPLSPDDAENPDRWGKVIAWLKEKNKTETDWPEIKKAYLITEASEKKLFEELGWLPF